MKCPKCRKEIDDIQFFCGYCGHYIKKNTKRKPLKKLRKTKVFLMIAIVIVLIIAAFAILTAQKHSHFLRFFSTVQEVLYDTTEDPPEITDSEGERAEDDKLEAGEGHDEEKYAAFSATAQEIEKYDADWQQNAMTQEDINVACETSYLKWDALLNEVYQYLKESMPADEFKTLEADELAWIAKKEAGVEAAVKEWEGGSGEAMARYRTAANYTKERCYLLLSCIDVDSEVSLPSQDLEKDVLLVAVSPDYAPFAFYENGLLTGFDIDLVTGIADYLNYRIEFKTCEFDELISQVHNRQVDLCISAFAITPERSEVVDFTDVYFTSSMDNAYDDYAILLPKGSLLKEEINTAIQYMKESGKIKALLQKYEIE